MAVQIAFLKMALKEERKNVLCISKCIVFENLGPCLDQQNLYCRIQKRKRKKNRIRARVLLSFVPFATTI